MPGTEPWLTSFKTNSLPTVLSIWLLIYFLMLDNFKILSVRPVARVNNTVIHYRFKNFFGLYPAVLEDSIWHCTQRSLLVVLWELCGSGD